MIKPSIGRVMWYRPGEYLGDMVQHDRSQPMMAHVCYVWGDHMVNLMVIDHDANQHKRTSVPIIQEGSPWNIGPSPYAEWMPFQKGQAAKTEAAELGAAARAAGPSSY
jgi:hypothetical protein